MAAPALRWGCHGCRAEVLFPACGIWALRTPVSHRRQVPALMSARPGSGAVIAAGLCVSLACAWGLFVWLGQGSLSHEEMPTQAAAPLQAPAPARVTAPAAQVRARTAAPTADELQQLAAAVQRLLEQANAGDAAAMWQIADIASGCYMTAGRNTPLDEALARHEMLMLVLKGADAAAASRHAGARQRVRCNGLAAHGQDRFALSQAWRQRAAKAGDLAARLRNGAYPPRPDPQAVARLIDETFASADPHALVEVGPLIMSLQLGDDGRRERIPGYEDYTFPDQTPEALSLLACERGLDCTAGSARLDTLCLAGFQCALGQDLPGLISSFSPTADSRHALAEAVEQMRVLLNDPAPSP